MRDTPGIQAHLRHHNRSCILIYVSTKQIEMRNIMHIADTPIDFSADILDSRDLIARMEYLTGLQEDHDNSGGDPLTEDETEELEALQAANEEGTDGTREWVHGATLIADSHLAEWAKDEASSALELMDGFPGWIADNIDWEGVARDLIRDDYNEIEIDGYTFHYLSY